MSNGNDERWWKAEKGKAHASTVAYVKRAEQELGAVFERIFLLECLYDPNSPDADSSANNQDRVTENAIASNVDTVAAVVATADIRSRYLSDGADWETQRLLRRLEWYSEDLQARYEVLAKCRRAFKEAAKKGNGLTKVHNVLGKPRVEHVLIENIVVPPEEARDGRTPMQIHQWDYVDADELTTRFPKKKEEIERARRSGSRRYASHSFKLSNAVECLWSYRLPIGDKGDEGYVPGRVTLVMDGCDLMDKPWERAYFPFGMITWTERTTSFYGIGGAERIMGIQRALNRRNWQIERALDQVAMPTTYVRPADANLMVKSNRVGSVAVVRGDYPQTVSPQALPGETYQSRRDLRESAQQEFGQTTMAVHGAKPSGLDSAVALREFKDQTTQRFGMQEKDFETLVLTTNWLLLDSCKELGAKAPEVTRRTRFGARRLSWKKVDISHLKVQMKAAANMNRTPAGRTQLVIEFAQAGIISTDQARRLTQHPDLERELSLYTAALESIEHDLDEIADGGTVMPEPYTNLEMAVWRGQREYLIWRDDGAPEDILESLRQYIVVAAARIADMETAANQNVAGPMPGAEMPQVPAGAMPAETPPQAALASQAMQLRAS